MGSLKGSVFERYLTIDDNTRVIMPHSFEVALAKLQSANFRYGKGIGENLRTLETERAEMHEAEMQFLDELEAAFKSVIKDCREHG